MATTDWAPTVANVGAQLRARTKDTSGNEVGTFTANTRPTDRQVAELIDTAVKDLADMLPEDRDVPQRLWGSARRVAMLDAAMQVELGYFPEQVGAGRSTYPQLKEQHDERLKRLQADLAAMGEDVTEGGTGTTPTPADPSYHFPTYPIIGWDAAPW